MTAVLTRLCVAAFFVLAHHNVNAQEFLSPKPMAPSPKPAPAQKPAPKPAAQKPAAPAQAASATAPKFDISEEIGDWKLQCLAAPARNCQMSQRRVNPSNNQLLIWMELTRNTTPKESNQLSVMVPLGLRAAPLVLTVDDQTFASMQLLTCIQTGCVYGVELAQAELQMLLKGNLIKTEVQDLRGQRFALTVSMRGFGSAFLKTAVYLQKS